MKTKPTTNDPDKIPAFWRRLALANGPQPERDHAETKARRTAMDEAKAKGEQLLPRGVRQKRGRIRYLV